MLALAGLGAVLRVVQYATPRSIHLDEVAMLLNLNERGWGDLGRPLDLGQTAAPGYLALQKAWLAAFGDGEYALRALPLLLSLAVLPLFVRLARRTLEPRAALAAMAMFALAPPLIFHASHAKPYSLDLLASTLLQLIGARWLAEPPRWAEALMGAAFGVLLPWLSQPAVFVAAGVGGALAIGTRARPVLGALAAWAVSSAAAVLWSRVHMSADTFAFMHTFWLPGFPAAGLGGAVVFLFFWVPFRFLYQLVGWPPEAALLVFPVVLVGVIALARSRPRTLALAGLPCGLAVGAALAGIYPFGGRGPWLAGRVILFLAPSAALLLGASAAALWERRRWRYLLRPVAMALPLGLLVTFVREFPFRLEEVRPALEVVARQARAGDQMYVGYGAYLPFRYYAERLDLGRVRVVVGTCARREPWRYVEELRRLRPGGVWVVSSNTFPAEDALLADYLGRNGRRLGEAQFPGTLLLHYELRGHEHPPDPRLVARPWAHHYRDCRGIWAAAALGS